MGREMSQKVAVQPPAHVLVVDDDHDIRFLVADALAGAGYRASTAASAREMDQLLSRDPADLILLDVMMPGEDGIQACRRLVRDGGPPVVFLSALGAEGDRVLGLETGASHYLPKPCSAREVLATVAAALRYRPPSAPGDGRPYRFAGWSLDPRSHELTDPNGVLVSLTDGEFAMLRTFLDRPRRILTRETLLDLTRGPDTEAFDRAIDVQISRLRRKLRAPGDGMIRTVRNEGYLFTVAVSGR